MISKISPVLAGLMLFAAAAHAKVIVVGAGGPYPTIQSGVNAANAGDTVVVSPGVYAEEVTVSTSVTIKGAGAGNTVVVPATSRPGNGNGSQLDTTAWLFT